MALKEYTLQARDFRAALYAAGLSLMAAMFVGGVFARAQDTTAATASSAPNALKDNESGFLGDSYSKLVPDSKDDDVLVYPANPDVMKTAKTFMVAPVVIYLLPEAAQREIDPADLAKLAANFEKEVTDELEKGKFKVVTEPGPGVTLIRLAITNVEPNGGGENAAVKGTAAVALHSVPGLSLAVPRVNVGRVSIEGELVDSVTGEQQVAFMTSKSGKRYFSGLKAYQKWGDINKAFDDWAENFRERLEKAQED